MSIDDGDNMNSVVQYIVCTSARDDFARFEIDNRGVSSDLRKIFSRSGKASDSFKLARVTLVNDT